MNNQTALLLIASAILIIVLFVIPSSENLESDSYVGDCTVNCKRKPNPSYTAVDCGKYPDAPSCKQTPDPGSVEKGIQSCAPSDGRWSIAAEGAQGRSRLNSECCQPPKFELGQEKAYKTCDDSLNPNVPEEACVQNCCKNAANEANNYDASWYRMARCGCSLWCYNKDVPHFKKYGTAVHYITGDLATAKTDDSSDFIGSGDFSGR